MAVARPRPDVGGDGAAAAAQRGVVEDVVVDQGRHVDQLDRGRGPHRRLAARLAGAERTSIGRSRLPPASSVAAASTASASPWPATAAGGADPRPRASRAGSQGLEASSTAVTGGGTAERRVTRQGQAAVDRNDAACEDRVRICSSPAAIHHRRQPGGPGKLRTDSAR